MSAPRVLTISPVPTHPHTAGNRARIFHLSSMLKSLGLEVHFLFTWREAGDAPAMNMFWGDSLHHFHGRQLQNSPVQKMIKAVRMLKHPSSERKYNTPVDEWYDPALDEYIVKLQARYGFQAVIVEYVFLSRALVNFGDSVLKIIDTHDVFTNRYQLYLKNNQEPQWFSTYEAEEAKALDRADIVLAVQKHEKAFFEKISSAKVVVASHIISATVLAKKAFEKKLLFVASGNPINLEGITFFMQSVLGPLIAKYADIQLLIAGTICRVLTVTSPNIKLCGEFDNPEKIYAAADIVINPVRFGTGLSIKALEALSFGKPMVATPVSCRGLEEFADTAFLVADTPENFIDAISSLIDNESLRDNLSQQALCAVRRCNERAQAQLSEIFHPLLSGMQR